MTDERPVNLEITSLTFPLAAIASILHRISGVGLFFGMSILLYLLEMSLSSETEFERAIKLLESSLIKLLIWLIMLAVFYHLIAGIKHLFLDLGIGESKAGAKFGAITTFLVFSLAGLLGGVWLW